MESLCSLKLDCIMSQAVFHMHIPNLYIPTIYIYKYILFHLYTDEVPNEVRMEALDCVSMVNAQIR